MTGREVEIKLRAASAAEGRRMLAALGFSVIHRRIFEANTVLDTPKLVLRGSGTLLRIREAGRQCTLTWKGPGAAGRHKDREEIETLVSNARALFAIFDRLGYRPAFRYEKYRTEYRKRGSRGVATLDETPIGVFIELEGPAKWIDATARKLGFTDADYITASYGGLYFEHCQRQGIQPCDMIFPKHRKN